MDNTTYLRLFFFAFTNEYLLKDTRYTFMAILKYQNMFGLENPFNLYGQAFSKIFDIKESYLDKVLEYLDEKNWIDCKKFEKYYEVKINIEFIDSAREKYLKFKKK